VGVGENQKVGLHRLEGIVACLGLGACSSRRLDWNLHEEIFCRTSSLRNLLLNSKKQHWDGNRRELSQVSPPNNRRGAHPDEKCPVSTMKSMAGLP
jgi:hypothetical protein